MFKLQDIIKTHTAKKNYSILIADEQNNGYVLDVLKLEYSELVDKLINIKYPVDKMQAIINNYLLESDNVEYTNEFSEMQKYRKLCKSFAIEIINYKK